MRIVASEEARELIAERGGRLYVSVTQQRCCHPVKTLAATADAAKPDAFRSLGSEAGFELFVPQNLPMLPDELVIEVRGHFSRRIAAYWDGCAWVV